jgi:hypothetical protein
MTKQRPMNVTIGTMNPMVLNVFLIAFLENFLVCIILSLITADTIIESQQVTKGNADNSPF